MEQMMGDMDIAFPHLGIYLQNVPKTIMVGNFGIEKRQGRILICTGIPLYGS